MTPAVHIVHRAAGRMRLRVAERRRDVAWLQMAAAQVAEVPGVESVEIGSETGSLLVRHGPDTDPEAALRAIDLWRFGESVALPPMPLDRLADAVGSLDRELRAIASENLDLRTLVFLSLLSLAIVQIWRGRFMAPAASLLWYALESVTLGKRS